jgi:hypothetical protein
VNLPPVCIPWYRFRLRRIRRRRDTASAVLLARLALDRALRFLERRQTSWGEFPSARYTNPHLRGSGVFESSPFTTTIVAHALTFVADRRAERMLARAMDFLEEEREEPGVWRYWAKRAAQPIPPDLDDTSCALSLFRTLAPRRMGTGWRDAVLAARDEHGRFRTWLWEGPNDVDAVVNANAVLLLGESSDTLPAIEFLSTIIRGHNEAPGYWYYLDDLALHYSVARAYCAGATALGHVRDASLRRIRGRRSGDGSFGDPLVTALAVCALVSWGVSAEELLPSLCALLSTQRVRAGWRRVAYYAGPPPPGPHSAWWGSSTLTTGLCVEALARGLCLFDGSTHSQPGR